MPKELKKRINEVQVSKRKEIKKNRAQLNEIENKNTTERVNETKR